jgi:hypothetical protein
VTAPWFTPIVAGFLPWRPSFDPRLGRMRLVVDKVVGTGVSSNTSVLPCPYHSVNAPHSSSTRCPYRRDKRTKPGNLAQCNALSGIGERCIEKNCHFFSLRCPRHGWDGWFPMCHPRGLVSIPRTLSFDVCSEQSGIGVDLCPSTSGSVVVSPPVLHVVAGLNTVQVGEAWKP